MRHTGKKNYQELQRGCLGIRDDSKDLSSFLGFISPQPRTKKPLPKTLPKTASLPLTIGPDKPKKERQKCKSLPFPPFFRISKAMLNLRCVLNHGFQPNDSSHNGTSSPIPSKKYSSTRFYHPPMLRKSNNLLKPPPK